MISSSEYLVLEFMICGLQNILLRGLDLRDDFI